MNMNNTVVAYSSFELIFLRVFLTLCDFLRLLWNSAVQDLFQI